MKPPYSRVTAYDLNTGTIAWQIPIGDGPRHHPLLKDLDLGPLGSGARGTVLATKTLLFVGSRGGQREGDTPEPPTLNALDKATGKTVWTGTLPMGPVASPMTFTHMGAQYVAIAVGGGATSELVAYKLP